MLRLGHLELKIFLKYFQLMKFYMKGKSGEFQITNVQDVYWKLSHGIIYRHVVKIMQKTTNSNYSKIVSRKF